MNATYSVESKHEYTAGNIHRSSISAVMQIPNY